MDWRRCLRSTRTTTRKAWCLLKPVQSFRAEVEAADGIVISSPEYAHGVPGSLKNALDWLVSVPQVVGKPVALVNASPRSIHAQASLAETLRTMSMALVSEMPFVVPLMERGLTAGAIAADRDLGAPLSDCIDALVVAVGCCRPGPASPPVTDTELVTGAL